MWWPIPPLSPSIQLIWPRACVEFIHLFGGERFETLLWQREAAKKIKGVYTIKTRFNTGIPMGIPCKPRLCPYRLEMEVRFHALCISCVTDRADYVPLANSLPQSGIYAVEMRIQCVYITVRF